MSRTQPQPQPQPRPRTKALVHQMCLRPEGASNSDCRLVHGLTVKQVSMAFMRLIDKGEIFKGAASPKVCRYFGTAAEAEAWSATQPATAGKDFARRVAAKRWAAVPAKPGTPGVKIDRRRLMPQGEAIIPAGIKITRLAAPTHDARFQLDPAKPVPGAGFSACAPGVNPLTGKAWGIAA